MKEIINISIKNCQKIDNDATLFSDQIKYKTYTHNPKYKIRIRHFSAFNTYSICVPNILTSTVVS